MLLIIPGIINNKDQRKTKILTTIDVPISFNEVFESRINRKQLG